VTTTVAVLGANGFVGRHVVTALRVADHDVAAVSRKDVSWPSGVESRLLDPADWRAAVRGAEVVVHLIARTHQLHEPAGAEVLSAYRSVNVDLTRDVLAACQRERVQRLVYMSSVKAMGESRAAPYVETDECHPVDAYGTTKLAAEGLVRAAHLETVVLRPPLVYGPGAGGNVARLASAVRRGLPLPLGRADALRSLVAVENLADAVLTAAFSPAAAGETFLVGDDEVLTVRQLVETLAAGAGRRARLVPVPVPLLRAVGAALRRSDEVARLTAPLVLDSGHIRRRLGWQPPVSAYDALRRVAAELP
jgi:UDP-glucose 4-epimerase